MMFNMITVFMIIIIQDNKRQALFKNIVINMF